VKKMKKTVQVQLKNPRTTSAPEIYKNLKTVIFQILNNRYEDITTFDYCEAVKFMEKEYPTLFQVDRESLTRIVIEKFRDHARRLITEKYEKEEEEKKKIGDRATPSENQSPIDFVWYVLENDDYDPNWDYPKIVSIFKMAYPIFCRGRESWKNMIMDWREFRKNIDRLERARQPRVGICTTDRCCRLPSETIENSATSVSAASTSDNPRTSVISFSISN
jgi:hypothetical protein